jgi:hypothetical protein
MDRTQKMTILMARADDIRRLALDELDDNARKTNTWGSPGHRAARDKVERAYDQDALRLEKLEEDGLDREFAGSEPVIGA